MIKLCSKFPSHTFSWKKKSKVKIHVSQIWNWAVTVKQFLILCGIKGKVILFENETFTFHQTNVKLRVCGKSLICFKHGWVRVRFRDLQNLISIWKSFCLELGLGLGLGLGIYKIRWSQARVGVGVRIRGLENSMVSR